MIGEGPRISGVSNGVEYGLYTPIVFGPVPKLLGLDELIKLSLHFPLLHMLDLVFELFLVPLRPVQEVEQHWPAFAELEQ
jgi:hypothetical protein